MHGFLHLNFILLLSITLDYDQVYDLTSFITSCHYFSPLLAISKLIRIEIIFHLPYQHHHQPVADPMSLTNIEEVGSENSSIVGESLLVWRESSKITVDNCVFQREGMGQITIRLELIVTHWCCWWNMWVKPTFLWIKRAGILQELEFQAPVGTWNYRS